MPTGGDTAPSFERVAEVASLLLPALARSPLRALAQGLAKHDGEPERAAHDQAHLEAMAGRMLAPGGWIAGHRRSLGETWWTGRVRPYHESTLRKSARAWVAAGAVAEAEQVLFAQVRRAVGTHSVTAYTDVYDQVYWTKKLAWAGPVGGLGNRRLACTYFGMTFVRVEGGPALALHVSWHKPATPLIEPLRALHQNRARARWLRAHVTRHILDRGTQGGPTLTWCLQNGVPYLTPTRGDVQWRRYRHPDAHTELGVPIFVREDPPLASVERLEPAQAPQVVIFPARPERGLEYGRAVEYRAATTFSPEELCTLDTVYKSRWPTNENPIKFLIAVGFDRNLDRTLDPTTSRGHDGESATLRAKLAAREARVEERRAQRDAHPTRRTRDAYDASVRAQKKAQARLAAHARRAELRGARSARGAEPLCKVLMLIVYNALVMWLATSVLEAVRVMTPERVRALLLGCAAWASFGPNTVTLWIESTPSTQDQPLQDELIRLVNAARLRTPRGRLQIRTRDPPGNRDRSE